MAEPGSPQKLTVAVQLTPEVAQRLLQAAELQKRTAQDIVLDLLDRHLPRLQSGEKKGKIPYT